MNNLTKAISIFALFTLMACSEKPVDKEVSKAPAEDAAMTGNKFADAAATKIMAFNQGFDRVKSNCIVTEMTKDGRYGLGEINQMKLSAADLESNSGNLLKAYKTAILACK